MKISIVLLILCTFQSSYVLTRDHNEVIEAFRPLILELHNILGRETAQLAYEEDGQHKLSSFERNINSQNQTLNTKLTSIMELINKMVKEIVSETGMVSHEDLIEHCYGKKNNEVDRLLGTAVAGQDICLQLAYMDLNNLNKTLNDIRDGQYKMHGALEDSLRTCNRSTENGAEMTSCMVGEYLFELTPDIGRMWYQIRENITNMEPSILDRMNSVNTCFSIVGDKANATIEHVTGGFRECCVAASQRSHVILMLT